MKFLHLTLIFLFFLASQSTLYSQIDQSYFYENNTSLNPRSIQKTNDNGYIVTGTESYSKLFILKIDSVFNVIEYKVHEENINILSTDIENINALSDTTFYTIFNERVNQDTSYNLSILTLDHYAKIIDSLSLKIPFRSYVTASVQSFGNDFIACLTGDKNILVQFDSIFQVKNIFSYSHETQVHFNFSNIHVVNDSVLLLSSYNNNTMILSTIDQNLDVIKSIEIEDFDKNYISNDLYVEGDSLYYIYQNDSYSNVSYLNFVTLDVNLNISSNTSYSFTPNQSTGRSKLGFVKVDSSRFIFYAGNSLIQSSKTHQLIDQIGEYRAFLDFHLEDSTTVILYKNGFTPATPGNLSGGSEFVILTCNSLDSIFINKEENLCINLPYSLDQPFSKELLTTSTEVTKDTSQIQYFVDSISRFRLSSLNLSNKCPEAPSSTTENENIELKLFPNPALQEINLESNKRMDRIVIYSFDGGIMYDRNYFSNKINVRLDGFIPGIYFVRVFQNGRSEVQKFVVM